MQNGKPAAKKHCPGELHLHKGLSLILWVYYSILFYSEMWFWCFYKASICLLFGGHLSIKDQLSTHHYLGAQIYCYFKKNAFCSFLYCCTNTNLEC